MRAAPVLLAVILLAACGQRMTEQPNRRAFETAERLPDHRVNQPPPDGSVARDELAAEQALATRPRMTAALLARGRERFEINCAPCHARTGEGDGMIVQRGFPHPPSYFEQRLVDAPDQHFLDVMTNGYGAMYSYAARVAPADRWAILAYIRALQLSRRVAAADLPNDLRAKLEGSP
ncbi:c-type cytochrome [Azospirillum brasilense]|uniref:c-type cytochrome n=1 Tax=Azospirillum brasilense TaxID=192 RepID=UPI000E67EAA4|nr:cytochrome c [Azospirillum brasilense]NUB27974.1 c-type cytochrome [Azospirillum brasilense]NUB35432.1 c-type cytochrome [Azospirillum brasilense]RIV97507.1 cytochrome c [Azospirillum brasilense]